MKIALVNLPWEKKRRWGVRAGSRWPHIKTAEEKTYLPFPFFLAYAAALLQKEGFEVCLIDALAEELPARAFLSRMFKEKPDLVVAETSTPSLYNDLQILKKLPRDLPIALCGPESNIRAPEFLRQYPFIDYVMLGEYEYTLLELARRLQAKKKVSGIKGLIYQTSPGRYQRNPERPLLEDLDQLPWPLRTGLPMEKYNDTPGEIPWPSVQMWSSRGCPYQCLFCVWPQLMYQTNRYRARSIVKVVDEMEYLVDTMGFRSIYFDDDTTNIGKLRMMKFAEEINQRGLRVPWAMMARADLMDEDILDNLRSAGLFAIKYGVESADQGLIDNICKNMDLRKTVRMIKYTKTIGIKTHLTFSFGLPGESKETIQKTIDLAMELDPDSLQFSITTAFPGTSYYRALDQKGHIVSRKFQDYDGNSKSMLRSDHLGPEELEKARKRAEKTWCQHVWKTRTSRITASVFWQKAVNYARRHSPALFLSRGFSFLKTKIVQQFFERVESITEHFRSKAPVQGGWRRPLKKMLWQYLDLLGIYHGSRAFKGPDCVQIDLTNNCNNNCISCWCNSPLLEKRVYRGSKKYKTLPALLVKSTIDELVGMGTREIFFSGGGEPFMHPEILSILQHAKARGLYCTVNTNFTLIDEQVAKTIIDLSVDALTVSIWAGRPQTYVRTHPNKDEAAFHKIKSILTMLNALKKNRKPFVKVYHVISNLNYSELETMADFAKETGCEAVEFTVVDTIPGATDKLILNGQQRKEVLELCESLKRRNSKVEIQNLEHFMRRLSDPGAENAQYDSDYLKASPCYVGWVFSRIMSDGDVNFCLKAHRIPVGNLYQKSFREIWNSEKQKEFRRKTLQSNFSDPFFKDIGNDEDCSVGCYKSCDNLGHNNNIKKKLESLNAFQKKALQTNAVFLRRLKY